MTRNIQTLLYKFLFAFFIVMGHFLFAFSPPLSTRV